MIVDGNGLAAHHGYMANVAKPDEGIGGLENTDVLDLYRLYAEENVCAP